MTDRDHLSLTFLSSSDFTLGMLQQILDAQGSSLGEVALEQLGGLESWHERVDLELLKTSIEACSDLQKIIEVDWIITQPTREHRGKVISNPVLDFAQKQGIKTFTPQSLNKELSDENFDHYYFDLAITASYGQIIAQQILDLPLYGFINWHPSKLPLYRGATPMQSVLRDGLSETGLSWITMTKGMDAGNLLWQAGHNLNPTDDFNALAQAMGEVGGQTWAIAAAIQVLKESGGELFDIAQEGDPTFCSMVSKDDAMVDPVTMTAQEIYNHYRAYIRWPRTSFESQYLGEKVRIDECELPISGSPDNDLITYENDEWAQTKGLVFLKCADQTLLQVRTLTRVNGKKLDFSGYIFN
jgi:methionyl-tRNA formyltransferase